MEKINCLLRYIICFPIKLYQYLLSPILGPCCRYSPSCSQYALDAIKHLGIIRGTWMAVKRICRCHPWSNGGYDPVFPNDEKY